MLRIVLGCLLAIVLVVLCYQLYQSVAWSKRIENKKKQFTMDYHVVTPTKRLYTEISATCLVLFMVCIPTSAFSNINITEKKEATNYMIQTVKSGEDESYTYDQVNEDGYSEKSTETLTMNSASNLLSKNRIIDTLNQPYMIRKVNEDANDIDIDAVLSIVDQLVDASQTMDSILSYDYEILAENDNVILLVKDEGNRYLICVVEDDVCYYLNK